MLISIFKFVIGAIVTVLLLTAVWHFFGPKEKAEASTLKSMDDIIVKLRGIEEGQTVIAYGYVDKDAAIVSFNSEQLNAGDFYRPKQCGARSNSCICAFKGKDKVLKCKGYPGGTISGIGGGGGGGSTSWGDSSGGGGGLKIEGGKNGKSFTLEFLLSGKTLKAREMK